MKSLDVAIWMITYNHESYIEQAIDSIMNQKTAYSFKLFLGEDCSTDRTRKLCISYQEKFPNKIELFLPKTNLGVKGPNGIGIRTYKRCIESNSRYIALCEGDDYWGDKLKLNKQIEFLNNNASYVAAYHKCSVIDRNGDRVRKDKWHGYKDHSQEELFYSEGEMTTPTVLFRNVLNKDHLELIQKVSNGDSMLWHILGNYGAAKFLPNIKPSAYRVHAGGAWSSTSEQHKLNEAIKTYRVIAQNIRNQNKSDQPIQKKLHQSLHQFLFKCLADRKFKEYFKFVFSGLKRLGRFKSGFLPKHFKAVLKRKSKLS